MSKLKVLHIVPWFPNPSNQILAIFIAEHLLALNNFCSNSVCHIQFGKKSGFENDKYKGICVDRITINPVFNKWVVKEKLVTLKIVNYLKKEHLKYDVINFYITYPNALKVQKISRIYPAVKFCMMEQWSAYHTQFDLEKENKGRLRIENIFNNNIPLFVVSSALGKDIQEFVGDKTRKFGVIPNCIDTNVFTYKEKINSNNFLFSSINNWSTMKNPIVLIRAFKLLSQKYNNVKLVLAGHGVLIPEMMKLVEELKMQHIVEFKGSISKDKVVEVLHSSNIYCQSSNYETFSAICIESLATGTPVLATNIGGMKDFINSDNGQLVNDLEIESWFIAMESNYLDYSRFNNKQISEDCCKKYNRKTVGKVFYDKLQDVYNGK
jgi:glycosyltransferase involved in cell wall biosynthesis